MKIKFLFDYGSSLFIIMIFFVFLMTCFSGCRKDSIVEAASPTPIDYTKFAYQGTYTGEETYIHTNGGWTDFDTAYAESYQLWLLNEDTTKRYLVPLKGVLDTLEIPFDSISSGSYYHFKHVIGVYPYYSNQSDGYDNMIDLKIYGDSLIFWIQDIEGADIGYNYHFAGKQE